MKFRIIFAVAIACLAAFFLSSTQASAHTYSGGPGFAGYAEYRNCGSCYHAKPVAYHKPKPPVHHPKKYCPPKHHPKPKPKPPIHHKPPVPSCNCGTIVYVVRCKNFTELIVVDALTGEVRVYHVV